MALYWVEVKFVLRPLSQSLFNCWFNCLRNRAPGGPGPAQINYWTLDNVPNCLNIRTCLKQMNTCDLVTAAQTTKHTPLFETQFLVALPLKDHNGQQWNRIQCGAVTTLSIFPKYSQKTLHNSLVRARYGVCFVSSDSELELERFEIGVRPFGL